MGRLTTALLAVALAAALLAPVADARDFNCDASAIRLQLGSAPTVEPVTANHGEASCKEVKAQTAAQSGAVSGGILLAQTTLPTSAQATATGGLGTLTVGQGALAGIPIPTLDAVNSLPAVTVPLVIPGLPSSVTVDIRPAVRALVAGLPNASLL